MGTLSASILNNKLGVLLSCYIYRRYFDKDTVIRYFAMAAKRVTTTAVNWAEFATKIPAANKAAFSALKNKQDGYLRAVNQLPEALPAIDFAGYKGRVSQAMVDDFEKKYKALDIPYPKDTAQGEIAAEEAKQKAAYDKFVAESKTRVEGMSAELAKWNAMMPIEDMNMEEAMVAVPHLVPEHRAGKVNFWPFDKDFDEWKKELEQIKVEYNHEHSMDPDAKGH